MPPTPDDLTSVLSTLVASIAHKDFLGPIPSLGTEATGLRFFEGGPDSTLEEDRLYKSVFDRGTTRYIYWQLDFLDVRVTETTDVEIISELFGINYEALDHNATIGELNPDTIYSWASLSHGFEELGNWDIGDYWIEVSIDGELVAVGGFEVVAETASEFLSIGEFAVACGKLNDRAVDMEFDDWVAMAQALEVPPEVADYWSAYVDQFALQTDLGPNAHTQTANVRAMELVVAMNPDVRETLLESRCLLEVEVLLSQEFSAARTRLEGGYAQSGTVTVEQFAEACREYEDHQPDL